jgi:hypothetical protein
MYSEEYKNWIARENESPPITEMIDFFKEYWANAIAVVTAWIRHGRHGR